MSEAALAPCADAHDVGRVHTLNLHTHTLVDSNSSGHHHGHLLAMPKASSLPDSKRRFASGFVGLTSSVAGIEKSPSRS